ncbi:hypothetical protein Fot_03934 [Forsythia ovata]|uniref:Uncharacterized protein n=1 Tax=Forsythia ovata TaxID=205694 RepID=A0ABD1XC00_9LAMI
MSRSPKDPISKIERSYPTPKKEVLPNLYEEGYYRSGGPTSISQVLPNPHKEGHYRPGGPTSIYQVLPRYLKSYLTSTKSDTIVQNVYLNISGLTSISQVTPMK